MTVTQAEQDFLTNLDETFAKSNQDFARAYFLFATAKLSDTINTQEIYAKYPELHQEDTFHHLKKLYDETPNDEFNTRLFTAVLETYIGNKLSAENDEFENLKNQLTINTQGLNIKDESGNAIDSLLYEDTPEWFKKIEDKATRQALYQRVSEAYEADLSQRFKDLFHAENTLMAEMGYADIVKFYSQTTGHNLPKLAQKGQDLVAKTNDLYQGPMAAYYQERTGVSFDEATRADIAYVFHGKSKALQAIDEKFPESNLVAQATKTFNTLGLNFSTVAEAVDYKTLEDYTQDVVNHTGNSPRILLDVTKREGKRSRAFVYPSKVPSEVYLSVKPEGGLSDYSTFFHESGHALHFAYTNPNLSYALAQMGNNTVTESYAYLFQNLYLNRHWLQHQAGLSAQEALTVVRHGALTDLYMLRRYASKMAFEIQLYQGDAKQGISLAGKDQVYADLLTQGTGFTYDAAGWVRDVDSGFYVADYFTAWTLEAQLRQVLCTRFGNPDVKGEDWPQNPDAGAFLKALWTDGNLTQQELSNRLGYHDPTDTTALLDWMTYNLSK
ncbi:MAG: hypothetical protein KTR14_00890 [Vampirovibrio sp.]|nr:hypothetical protein [Vampirovibrio sp.]